MKENKYPGKGCKGRNTEKQRERGREKERERDRERDKRKNLSSIHIYTKI